MVCAATGYDAKHYPGNRGGSQEGFDEHLDLVAKRRIRLVWKI